MRSDIDLIKDILYARIDKELLNGYCIGLFNNDKDKLFASTYVKIDIEEYHNISYYLERIGGCGSYGGDHEEMKKNITAESYQIKSSQECVEEGIYKAYSVSFQGIFYEKRWYINKHLTYFGNDISEEKAKEILLFHGYPIDEIWNGGMYVPNKTEYKNFPDGRIYRDVEDEEFAHIPNLVSILKKDKKQSINRLYRAYLSEEVFLPLFEKIKILYPNQYHGYAYLMADRFVQIFPEHKKYTMMFWMVSDNLEKFRLEVFIYMQENSKIYQWLFIDQKFCESEYNFAEEVISILKDLSDWNYEGFLNSSRTLDDEHFWNEYVFKKENDEYKYLKEFCTNL